MDVAPAPLRVAPPARREVPAAVLAIASMLLVQVGAAASLRPA